MQKLVGAAVVAVALLATACGGSAGVQDETAAIGAADAADDEQARRLIDQLGSDDAAADALVIAMDRGYSAQQILDAVASGDVQANGTLSGQEPARRPLGLVLYASGGDGEGAVEPEHRPVDAGTVTLVSFFQPERTPIEKTRDRNTSIGGVGVSGTQRILLLLRSDFTPSDIIEILIFGRDETVGHPELRFRYCVRVVDELYCPNGERFPVQTEPEETETEPTAESFTADNSDDSDAEGKAYYSGEASADAVEFGRKKGSAIHIQALSYEVTLVAGEAQMTVVATYEVTRTDCTGLMEKTLTGSGPTGINVQVDLAVANNETLSLSGECPGWDERGEFLVNEFNRQVGQGPSGFSGNVDDTGFAGSFKTPFANWVSVSSS